MLQAATVPQHDPLETLREQVYMLFRKFAVYVCLACSLSSEFLRSFTSYPLHEAFYYMDGHAVQEAFLAKIRSSVKGALVKPQKYFQSNQLDTLDICHVYKTYRECGKLINLYDWFLSFTVGVAGGDSTPTAQLQYPACNSFPSYCL